MSQTDGQFTQDTPFADLQIFRGPSDWLDTSSHAVYTQSGGLYYLHLPATNAATFVTDCMILQRTGIYATPALTQEQFGTAASLPGPTTVAHTSDPEGVVSYPPFLAAALPTLAGPHTGPVAKGMMLTSVDVIYRVNALAAGTPTFGVTATVFANTTAPVTTNLIASDTNGLQTAVNANPYVINIPVTTPGFIITPDTELLSTFNITGGATGTVDFFGTVAHYSFNFN